MRERRRKKHLQFSLHFVAFCFDGNAKIETNETKRFSNGGRAKNTNESSDGATDLKWHF